jgi:hypothetical protein
VRAWQGRSRPTACEEHDRELTTQRGRSGCRNPVRLVREAFAKVTAVLPLVYSVRAASRVPAADLRPLGHQRAHRRLPRLDNRAGTGKVSEIFTVPSQVPLTGFAKFLFHCKCPANAVHGTRLAYIETLGLNRSQAAARPVERKTYGDERAAKLA